MGEFRTQKANGIIRGIPRIMNNHYEESEHKYSRMRCFMSQPQHYIVQSKEDVKKYHGFPCFARPCPTVPRHGFVDSRTIHSRSELLKLWEEVLEQDKDGEIVIGPHYDDVERNAVYVSSGNMSIGGGNDGATAGKGSISFPVAPHQFSDRLMKRSGLSKDDALYFETIFPKYKSKWYMTQIRGGPSVDAVSSDYIPAEIKVSKVVVPHDDLLRWEKEVSEFTPGTVVYGSGHTLASHAAIHCVLNKIPFVTSFEPKVGAVLQPIEVKERKVDRKKFKQGVKAGIKLCEEFDGETRNIQRYFYFSITVLHNWAYLKHSEYSDWLLGAASTIFAKIGAALIQGEHRHHSRSPYKNQTRSRRYQKSLKDGIGPFKTMPGIFKNFHGSSWKGGFGGVPWATCTWYTYSLWNHIVKLYNKSSKYLTEKETADLVTMINKTVNIAHNNGWWFNKIADKSDLDFAAYAPGVAAYCVAEVYERLVKMAEKTSETFKKFAPGKKLERPFTKHPKDSRMTWVQIAHAKSPRTELILTAEDGKAKHLSVELDAKEYRNVKRFYNDRGRNRNCRITLPVKKEKFKFPGQKYQDIGEVFGWHNV